MNNLLTTGTGDLWVSLDTLKRNRFNDRRKWTEHELASEFEPVTLSHDIVYMHTGVKSMSGGGRSMYTFVTHCTFCCIVF